MWLGVGWVFLCLLLQDALSHCKVFSQNSDSDSEFRFREKDEYDLLRFRLRLRLNFIGLFICFQLRSLCF